jgi:hypothetical protein
LPADVYYYQLSVDLDNGESVIKKGFIHLNR